MPLHVALLSEAFFANSARKLFFTRVYDAVSLQMIVPRELFTANTAPVHVFPRVQAAVMHHVALFRKRLFAYIARELLVRLCRAMLLQCCCSLIRYGGTTP